MRWGLLAWALWLLVSTLGGAVGGLVSEPLEIVGVLFLPGVTLGAAQALVLQRYLRGTGYWAVASFVGWFAGWVVIALENLVTYYLIGVPEGTQQIGSAIKRLIGTEGASTVFPIYSLVWVVFAAFQFLALWTIVVFSWA